MFWGEYECSIDDKGRLMIPSKLRNGLNSDDVVVTFIDENTMLVSEGKSFDPSNIVKSASVNEEKILVLLKYIIVNSYSVRVDSQGRILIPKNITSKLKDFKNVMVVGRGNFFVVNNKEKYLQERNEIVEEAKAYLTSEEGRNFTLGLKF